MIPSGPCPDQPYIHASDHVQWVTSRQNANQNLVQVWCFLVPKPHPKCHCYRGWWHIWRIIGDEKQGMVACWIAISMAFVRLLWFIRLDWQSIIVRFVCFSFSICGHSSWDGNVNLSNMDFYEAIFSWCHFHCWFDVISCATKNTAEFACSKKKPLLRVLIVANDMNWNTAVLFL